MNTWTKETDRIFLDMWGRHDLAEIAVAVNNWHRENARAKDLQFAPITTARGVIYHALKHGLISRAEVETYDKQQRSEYNKRKRIPVETLQIVIQRDGNKCLLCGRYDELTVSHILPINRGGNSDIKNLQTLCEPCRKKVKASGVDFRKPYIMEQCDHCGREQYKNVE